LLQKQNSIYKLHYYRLTFIYVTTVTTVLRLFIVYEPGIVFRWHWPTTISQVYKMSKKYCEKKRR